MTAPSAANSTAFRKRFPMLNQTVHLASCSLGARSLDVDEAFGRMLAAMHTNGAPWAEFEAELEAAREGFAALVNARPEQIAIVPNASIGAYQVASSFDWSRRRNVVTTDAEFPSIAHVWLAQETRGARVVHVRSRAHTVHTRDYVEVLDRATAAVSIPLATYRTSARLDVGAVAAAARAVGAKVFVDAYQSVGVEPVDVAELDCDYLVAGSMKYLLGLPGVAYLYVRDPKATARLPELTGWLGRVDPFAFDPFSLDFPDEARRYETGTPAVPAVYAANAGLRLIESVDIARVREHVRTLTAAAVDLLTDQGEILLLPEDPTARGAHVAVLDDDASGTGKRLADRGIAVSPRGDALRLAFHYYNSRDDVDAVCGELAACRRHDGPPSRRLAFATHARAERHPR